jgi:hypothetical protein
MVLLLSSTSIAVAQRGPYDFGPPNPPFKKQVDGSGHGGNNPGGQSTDIQTEHAGGNDDNADDETGNVNDGVDPPTAARQSG